MAQILSQILDRFSPGRSTPWGGGVTGAGSSGMFQGYVETLNELWGTGLTIGTSAGLYGGPGAMFHEYGHTLQFLGLTALGANSGGENIWNIYLGLGGIAAAAQMGWIPVGTFWEDFSDYLGYRY